MKDKQGMFIVIEGTDGSGKGTQFKKLVDRLENEGYDVATFDFPQYEQPSSYFVKEYLNGKYGTADEVGPYTASLFFSLDRYEAAAAIREAIEAGKVVIANRFTGSNMAHQGTKFSNAEQRRGYFIWLDSLEYQMLGIPRPNQNIVLRVPAKIAQELVDHKEARSYTDKKRDIHEADLSHLERSVEVYDDLCHLFPKDFTRIDCVRSGELLSIEAVAKLIWEKIYPMLPAPPKNHAAPQERTKPAFYVPGKFDAKVSDRYLQQISQLLEQRETLLNTLHAPKADTERIAELLLPLAAFATDKKGADPLSLEVGENAALSALASEAAATYGQDSTEPVNLIDFWPRNELSIIPDVLYAYSDAPFSQLARNVNQWPYEKKADVLGALVRGDNLSGLDDVQYTVDVMTDYATLQTLLRQGFQIEHQQLTPRYGYDTPGIVADAGLSELYESCFDASLALYSQLQAAGYGAEAAYATLLGHKLRAKITLDYAAVKRLTTLVDQPTGQALAPAVLTAIAEVHPLLGTALAVPTKA